MGITLNLPGITIGPFHIKFSIRIDTTGITNLTGSEGVQIGLVVQRSTIPLASTPYPNLDPAVDWIWNEWFPVDEFNQQVVDDGTPLILTKAIHCKSMRKLGEAAQTVFLIAVPTGGVTIDTIGWQSNVMCRLP